MYVNKNKSSTSFRKIKRQLSMWGNEPTLSVVVIEIITYKSAANNFCHFFTEANYDFQNVVFANATNLSVYKFLESKSSKIMKRVVVIT